MGIQMNISEAKAKLSELVRRAEAGEEVLLMRDGTVVAVIAAQGATKPRRGGMRVGLLAHLGPLKNPEQFLEGCEPEDMEIGPDPGDESFAPKK